MCKYCKTFPGVGRENKEKYINTKSEFNGTNTQRINSTHNIKNTTYAIINNYKGCTPAYEGKVNGTLDVEIPEAGVTLSVCINYCPFCGEKLGEVEDKFV